jgi:V8-like Glu-specific endopeptidase
MSRVLISISILLANNSYAAVNLLAGLHPNIFCGTGHYPAAETFRNPALQSIGRIYNDEVGVTRCAASLVDCGILMTDAHCLKNHDGTNKTTRTHFITGASSAKNGVPADIDMDTAVALTNDYDSNPQLDVAFVRIKTCLDSVRFPPVKVRSALSFNVDKVRVPVHTTGYFEPPVGVYPDRMPTSEVCDLKNFYDATNELTHDCSVSAGMSGSPVYVWEGNNVVVIGVNNGAAAGMGDQVIPYSDIFANRAVDGGIIAKALEKFKAGTLVPDSL